MLLLPSPHIYTRENKKKTHLTNSHIHTNCHSHQHPMSYFYLPWVIITYQGLFLPTLSYCYLPWVILPTLLPTLMSHYQWFLFFHYFKMDSYLSLSTILSLLLSLSLSPSLLLSTTIRSLSLFLSLADLRLLVSFFLLLSDTLLVLYLSPSFLSLIVVFSLPLAVSAYRSLSLSLSPLQSTGHSISSISLCLSLIVALILALIFSLSPRYFSFIAHQMHPPTTLIPRAPRSCL